MPWTFAHPAAVLPLRRLGPLRLPLLGLILGSFSPDFAYYANAFALATFAHTPAGIVFVCLPSSFVLAALIAKLHLALIAPLPQPHRAALAALKPPQVSSISVAVTFCLAVILGALTHAVWDSFTHSSGLVVSQLPLLRREIGQALGHPILVYSVLQHTSTVVGAVVLLGTYRRWLLQAERCTYRDQAAERRRTHLLVACGLVAVAGGATLSLNHVHASVPLTVLAVRAVIFASAIFILLYLLLALRTWRPRGA